MLTPDIRRLVDESVLCWLATSSAAGQPSVSPKEIFAAHNDSIIIANIASPGSARNLRANPRACVSFINIFTQKGYQIAGSATVLEAVHAGHAEAETILLRMTQGNYPFKTIFRVEAKHVKPIIAPRYKLFPDTTEQMQIDGAMHTYGVRPAN